MSAAAAWLWVPIVLWAALAQTARNAAQRSLVAQAGTLGATLARFLYGIPFAAAWVLLLHALPATAAPVPRFGAGYFGWLLLGALGQLAATAFLLAAMKQRNFVVGVAYSKTDALQVALFGALFLRELPGWLDAAGDRARHRRRGDAVAAAEERARWRAAPGPARAALVRPGLGRGLRAVGRGLPRRGAAAAGQLALAGRRLGRAAGAGRCRRCCWAAGWRCARPAALRATVTAWRVSTVAGATGALASIGWFTAFALTTAANVRTLGMVEVVFSYLVSRRLLREKLAAGGTRPGWRWWWPGCWRWACSSEPRRRRRPTAATARQREIGGLQQEDFSDGPGRLAREPTRPQPFTLYAAGGRIYARNADQKLIDLGALTRDEEGGFRYLLEGNGKAAKASSPRRRRCATSRRTCASSGSTASSRRSPMRAKAATVNLEGATRLDIVLDELDPGERAFDATV